jgi:hypothetical protein
MSCNHAKKVGYVSNQPDDYDKDRALASQTVCKRDACIEAAMSWVFRTSLEPGFFRTFKGAAS